MATARGARRAHLRGKAAAPDSIAKIIAPKPARLYRRERLFTLLDRAREDNAVIWVSAPAGAGKTSLAATYVTARKLRALWYQVDAGDGDIASFFYYIGLAAVRVAARHKTPLPVFTPEYLADLPTFARNYFRELYRRLPKSSIVILDNYQDAPEESALHQVLSIAMQEVPKGLNLLVLSRTEPPPALARLRLSEHAACIDWSQMQLTPEETVGIGETRAGKSALPSQDLAVLHERAHGWAAGVVLMLEQSRAGMGLSPAQIPSGQKLIFDYFAGELFARARPAVQDFLLKTALCPKLSVRVARELTGNESSQAILDDLTRRNFFTVRQERASGDTYEYHPLFREFLTARACATFGPETLSQLRSTAARALEAEGEIEAAAELLRDAAEWRSLARLVVLQAQTLFQQGRLQTLSTWIERIPPEQRQDDPWLLYWHGAATLPRDPFAGYDLFEAVYRRFCDLNDVRGRYLAWIGVANGLFFRNDDMSPAREWIEELERLRAEHPRWPDPDIGARVTIAALSILTMGYPEHPALPQWLAQAEQLFQHVPVESVRCVIGAHLGIYYSFWGEVGKLSAMAKELRPLAESPGVGYVMRLFAHTILVLDAWQSGDDAAVLRTIEQGLKLIEESGAYITAQWLLGTAMIASHSRNRLELTEQLLERYRKWLHPRRRTGVGYYHYQVGWLALSRARPDAAKVHFESAVDLLTETHSMFFLAQARAGLIQACGETGDFARAQDQLDAMRRDSAAMRNRLFLDFQCNYLDAYLRDKQGDSAGAAAALRQSFEVAAHNNWIAQSSWEPAIIARLCLLALENDIEPDLARRLVRNYRLRPPAGSEATEQWPHGIKLYTLGRFVLMKDDHPVATASGKGHKKPIELLQTLIALGGRQVAVDHISGLLWPDAEGDAGVNLFKITLHRLRKLIAHDNAIEFAEGRLSLNANEVWVDSWALARLLAEAEVPAIGVRELAAIADRAFGLYRGHFLEREPAANAALLRCREQLRSRMLRAVKALAHVLEQAHDWPLLVKQCERAFEIDDVDEDFYAAVMRGYLAQGRYPEALAAFGRAQRIYAALDLKTPTRLADLKARALAEGSRPPH